jgi:hypothetical protein
MGHLTKSYSQSLDKKKYSKQRTYSADITYRQLSKLSIKITRETSRKLNINILNSLHV